MSEREISVLLATRRRPTSLAATLRSLADMDTTGLAWQLIVIDNDGDAATQAAVRAEAHCLPVTLLVEPIAGKNRALNRGLPHATGDLIVFTDDDVAVGRDWLRQLSEGAARWPAATLFGGRVLPQWPDGCEPSPAHPFFDHAYAIADFAHPEGRYSSGYVYGSNMCIRSVVFAQGWRFDERLGPDGTERYVTGSETSLTVALERAGHLVVYLPLALVHHRIRPEQLTARWLNGRAFRKGRADARKAGLTGGRRAVPPDLVLQAKREYSEWQECRRRGDEAGALDRGIAYWTTRGKIYHCRRTPSG